MLSRTRQSFALLPSPPKLAIALSMSPIASPAAGKSMLRIALATPSAPPPAPVNADEIALPKLLAAVKPLAA